MKICRRKDKRKFSVTSKFDETPGQVTMISIKLESKNNFTYCKRAPLISPNTKILKINKFVLFILLKCTWINLSLFG